MVNLFHFICFSDCQLYVLRRDLRSTRRESYAAGTSKNHRSSWRSYALFCLHFHLHPLPASTDTLCLFAQFLSRSMTIQSIANNLSAVKKLHQLCGHSITSFESIILTDTVNGLRRLIGKPPSRKLPITPDILSKLHSIFNLNKPKHLALWASFLIAFFTFSRKSNIVPPTMTDFDTHKHLCRRDIQVHADHLVISFNWSKTNQFHQRIVSIPVSEIPGSILCPVTAFKTLLHMVPASGTAPAFIYSISPVHFFHHESFSRAIKDAISQIGLDSSRFSGHSFRRGGATFAFASDVPSELIKLHGDWRSSAYLSYLEYDLSARLSVTERMRNLLLNSSSFSSLTHLG